MTNLEHPKHRKSVSDRHSGVSGLRLRISPGRAPASYILLWQLGNVAAPTAGSSSSSSSAGSSRVHMHAHESACPCANVNTHTDITHIGKFNVMGSELAGPRAGRSRVRLGRAHEMTSKPKETFVPMMFRLSSGSRMGRGEDLVNSGWPAIGQGLIILSGRIYRNDLYKIFIKDF